MVTNPTDFASYAWGVELNSANYSGGAGGTFTDLVQGAGYWTVASATPTFATRDGLEGMEFTKSSTEDISAICRTQGEMTVVAIFEADDATSHDLWGPEPGSNSEGMLLNAFRLLAQDPSAGDSGYASYGSGQAVVGAVSWCPENNTNYATTYDGVLRKSSDSNALNGVVKTIAFANMSIGKQWFNRLNGWIGEVHGFHRSLHFRDETALDDMLVTLGAKVGI